MKKITQISSLDLTIQKWTTNRYWLICIVLLLLHLGLSLAYGYYLPWGGDEWYTYRDQVFVGTPNNWLVLAFKKVLGPVTPDNYHWYRQVGLFWTVWIYPATAMLLRKASGSQERATLLLFLLIFTFSPFICFQEQMFRYYGLYLLYSFIVNIVIFFRNTTYTRWRWLFYMLFILSFPVHYLITWQLFFYIVWKEFSLLSRRLQAVAILTGLAAGIIVVVNLEKIWNLIFVYGEVKGEIRGWGLQSLLKPALAVFQYLAGYELLPTDRVWILALFLLTGILFVTGLGLSLAKSSRKVDFLFAGFIPFLSTFLLLEPITMPGATNLESKHAMFFIFWMVYYLVAGLRFAHSKGLSMVASMPILIMILTGMYHAFATPNSDWRRIGQLLGGSDIVFTDGPTRQTLDFYTTSLNPKPRIETIWDTMQVRQMLAESSNVSFVLSDYKQYQLLTKEQMWNTGSSSLERFSHVNALFTALEEVNFQATGAYTHYPLLAYRFSRHKEQGLLPWFYEYPYADLHFPLSIGQDTLLGMHIFQQGDTLALDQPFYYFVEARQKSGHAGLTVLRSAGDSLQAQLLPLTPETNTFRSVYCRALQGYGEVAYEWRKRPLLSSSLAYPGSILPGRGKVFRFQPQPGDQALVLVPDIRLYRFVLNK